MKTVRWFCAAVLAAVLSASAAPAQEPPKPGPEHEMLKKMEGTWDATMKFAGMESKGTMIYKMELGGLWLTSSFEGEFGGGKFSGRGLDTYDAGKKKFISVWVDSMVTTPMILEGTYDKDKKTLTMSTDFPGPDGKVMKWKSTTEMPDNDNMTFNMFMGDGKDPAFTITYKRKK
jgi:Protein of unknown function (DUF1579)